MWRSRSIGFCGTATTTDKKRPNKPTQRIDPIIRTNRFLSYCSLHWVGSLGRFIGSLLWVAVYPLSVHQPQELFARDQRIPENTTHRARHRGGVLLLDATHHHAQMLRFDDHTHALRLEHIHQRIRDLIA